MNARKLAVACAAFAVTLAVVEGGSRLALLVVGESRPAGVRFLLEDVWQHETNPFHREDPLLLWRLVPGFEGGPLRVNSLGFRGGEIALPKPDGTLRIVLLGDSITFGFGVREEDTFAARLAERLSHDPALAHAEVVNAGVTGYSSWQGRKLYETAVRRIEPDLVVVMFGYPDHHYAVESDREKTERRTLDSARRLARASGAYRLFDRLAGEAEPRLRSTPVPRVGLDEFRENLLAIRAMAEADGARTLFMTVPLRPGIPLVENFRAVESGGQTVWLRQLDFAIARLGPDSKQALAGHFLGSKDLGAFVHDSSHCQRIATEAGSHPDFPIFHYLLAACFRAFGDTTQAERELGECERLDLERREMEAYNEALRELAAESRIDLLDLARTLAERAGGTPLFLDVAHPGPEGNERIAEILAARIGGRS